MNSKALSTTNSVSIYTAYPEDPQAVYLTPDHSPVKADGISDDTDALQEAINQVKAGYNFGIVFIPEGTYLIRKTIYIPKAIRLIGYGKKRPLILLGENSPGFQAIDPQDKGQANYMFWFTSDISKPGEPVQDANAGTFYSAISNIDLKIEDGNPAAVALRTHFAQNSFIAHMDIHIGNGKAGIFDVGNEIEDVRCFGGEYGIYTTKPSPGWPFMMVDTYFEGQRKAAIKTQEAGLTIIRMNVRNVPTVVETNPGFFEKLYMEDCRFDNISGPAIIISNEFNAHTQINLRNIDCRRVPVLASFRQSGKQAEGAGSIYKVKTFTHGNHVDDLGARPAIKTILEMEVLDSFPSPAIKDIPDFPAVETWVNLKNLGAQGDGIIDDTQVIQDAIDKHPVIYVPQGWYRVSETIRLKPETVLIGLNPIGAQFILADNTEAFGGFGPPKPLLETPKAGANIISGIGLDAGGRNPRAVGCKWMAGPGSYLNDVKFIGGHGSMNHTSNWLPPYNENRTADANLDRKWDSQYWSLWITSDGGGIFKDIWIASPYATAGLYISDTSAEGRIYSMSVEHHVRNEVKFKNVSNWKVYALQLEEEIAESWNCLPLEIDRCCNLLFANLYLFRVIWLANPYPYAIKTWDSTDIEFLNIHNFTQVKYTIDNTLFDVNTKTEVRPWQIARLYITGKAPHSQVQKTPVVTTGVVQKLAGGFEFIDAVCRDGKGNIYFSDSRWKRIYQWSAEANSLRLITDIHFKPLSLACDTNDHLLVTVEYSPPIGATIDGKPETYPKPEDASGTSYGRYYNIGSTIKVYAIDPDRPEESMQILESVPMGSVTKVSKALYPANRWRDNNDYLVITVRKTEECYIAPDGVTIIPVCYDLIRANSLLEAYPGQPFYAADEYNKRTVLFQVSPGGYLTDPKIFVEKGEYNTAADTHGNVYVPDGEIYVYNQSGELIGEITVPERPACIVLGDADRKTLYITARSSLYRVRAGFN
jgi:hypothetical protein